MRFCWFRMVRLAMTCASSACVTMRIDGRRPWARADCVIAGAFVISRSIASTLRTSSLCSDSSGSRTVGIEPSLTRRGALRPVLAKDRPHHQVVEAALRVGDLARDTLEPASALLRDPPGADVPRIHADDDAVERHPAEAEVDHRRARFSREALPPVRLPDHVADLRGGVLDAPRAVATGPDELPLGLQLEAPA